jgi:S-DNA-T family DNA segregation ATPase FtsK/SpoIIIE
MILSLAMTNPAASPASLSGQDAGLALVLIDPKGHAFRLFEGLPHLARPVIRETEETTEALDSLVRLMERQGPCTRSTAAENPVLAGRRGHRTEELQGLAPSRVVLMIDELADVLMTGGKPAQWALTRLTQRGREAGIHVVAATQKPTSAVLGPLVKANFPVRLVGRVTSIEDARTATGWGGTGAERLMGRGDFLAVAEGRVTRFQAAHVSAQEIRATVARVARDRSASAPARTTQGGRCIPQLSSRCSEGPTASLPGGGSSSAPASPQAALPGPAGQTAAAFGGEARYG